MFRVFEALDELVQTVEEAYGVPMTANCMVPRRDVLVLLDELRDALPQELDDAQDVLDQRDSIIAEAEATARRTVADADEEATRLVDDAAQRADGMVRDAEDRAHATVAKAQEDADRRRDDADREYAEVTERAAAEADRLLRSGNEAYDRSVREGLEEQARLVSESEVMREATEQSRRLVENAHADSNRLRGECDVYVDNKLAEFEDALSSTLRTVSKDRAALRRGAGAAGTGSRYNRPDHGDEGFGRVASEGRGERSLRPREHGDRG
ncbi:DivIVA domain-containing protein [Corynebacterium sp.]|uniref:DivIVA domain-containing protein n=1 Tax=Corynebacterium sp. TaxID=1720 RepID=UPI0026DD0E29|nr:DivIVA domain-containing protein [Corynebacterium sp.]MDO4611168.1 DivIVA domain-containing protein [Corynebacterium sp.]